jgi:serine/threonine protein kinase
LRPCVPDYDLLRQIGGGAYGEVWLARNRATGVLRAAKIVWRRTFQDDRPFQREFDGIQKFERISREHPSQLALFHIGRNEEQGYFYYVMELADPLEQQKRESREQKSETARPQQDKESPGVQPGGRAISWARGLHSYTPHTLRAELAHGRLPPQRVLELGLALVEALTHLHGHGLVHRDVKPSNVIFINGRPKLADIGLVTDASDQCSIVGTEGYLPPEGPGTPQADIFALGKVLYEAATGKDRREFPKLPEELRSWSDAKTVFELNEIVLKACASKSGERYLNVEQMLAELQALQAGRSVKRKRLAQWYWRGIKRKGLALSAASALAVAFAALLQKNGPADPAPEGPDSTNASANVQCRRALNIMRDDMSDQFGLAYTNLSEAIERDPRFGRPWMGMLELRLRERVPGLEQMKTNELHKIADKLDELLHGSAPAYCAHAAIEFSDWHFPQAEEYAKKAIAANPKYELAHTFYAYMLVKWGKLRLEDARQQLNIGENRFSGKVTYPRGLGHIAYAGRNFIEAIACYSNALWLEPRYATALRSTARAYQAMGKYTNAIETSRAARMLSATTEADREAVNDRYDRLAEAYRAGGCDGYWTWQWNELAERSGSYYEKAVIRMNLRDTNGALSWLNASYTNHEYSEGYLTEMMTLLFDECWDDLHDNPQFQDLLQKMTFTQVMRNPSQRTVKKRISP